MSSSCYELRLWPICRGKGAYVEIDFIEVAIGMKDNVHVVETSDLRDGSERRRDEKQGKDHHILVGAEVMEKPKAR